MPRLTCALQGGIRPPPQFRNSPPETASTGNALLVQMQGYLAHQKLLPLGLRMRCWDRRVQSSASVVSRPTCAVQCGIRLTLQFERAWTEGALVGQMSAKQGELVLVVGSVGVGAYPRPSTIFHSLVYLVIYDSGQVSLQHFLLSPHPSYVQPTNPESITPWNPEPSNLSV